MSNNLLSQSDIEAKDNLVRIWNEKKAERGFTQESAAAEIAARSGKKTNQSALGHYLNGRRKLTLQATLRFADFLHVPPEEIAPELDYGYGMGNNAISQATDISLGHKSDAIIINQYNDVCGSMGSGITLRDQPGQITEWIVTPEWAEKNLPNNTGNKNLRVVTGFGDSMRGMFNSGDPLIVDTGINNIDYDGVYFFRIGDEGFIKRLQRIPGEGIRAISENKAYETWTIKHDMDFEVFGRVLKVWKSEGF